MASAFRLLPVVFLLALPFPCAGQAGVATGSVQGELSDLTGAALPGVHVRITAPDSGFFRRGKYR